MDIRAIFLGLTFAFMWSSAFTSARIIVQDAPPVTALALRFLISGLIGVGLAAALGQTARLNRAQWRSTIIFGICQNAMYLGLNFVAMRTIEAGLASIIASSMPLMVGMLGWIVFRERLPALGIVAAVLGVIKTMASIDQPPEVLGKMIGGALVGTFLGVFLAYGLVGPFATKVKTVVEQDHCFYLLIREVLVANLHNHAPDICVEVGRQNTPGEVRPSFADLAEALRGAKT